MCVTDMFGVVMSCSVVSLWCLLYPLAMAKHVHVAGGVPGFEGSLEGRVLGHEV